jgi:DNA polymerase-3 subunit beta
MAIELLSQLIESTYPDFRALIPKEYNTRVVVKKDAFLKALKIAHLFAKDRDNMVKLEIAPASELLPGSLTIRATSRQYGDNVSQVEAKVQGAPLEIAFNVKYLIEALSVMEEDEIALEATTSSSPGVLKPADGEDFIHVVMPMYLEEE